MGGGGWGSSSFFFFCMLTTGSDGHMGQLDQPPSEPLSPKDRRRGGGGPGGIIKHNKRLATWKKQATDNGVLVPSSLNRTKI